MPRPLSRLFSALPVADPIDRQLTPLVAVVLVVAAPLALLQAVLIIASAPLTAPTLIRLLVNGIALGGDVAGLVLLTRGRFRAAVVTTSASFMAAFALGNVGLGVWQHRSQLSLFAVPLALVGLMLGRRWLFAGAAFAIGSTVVAALVDPGLVPTPPGPREPQLVLVITSFTIVMLLLTVLFDRFSDTMRRALAASLSRERELELVKQSLEARSGELATANAEMQRAMAERQRLEHELLHAQKMESIGRLAGGVAHDFNNLLTVVVGYADALVTRLPPTEPAREDALAILDASGRAAELTKQLLAFARRQALETRELEVHALVDQSERLLRRVVGTDIEIEVRPAGRALFVRADASQMQQVLLNLAFNARDAMPRGGSLTVTIAEEMVDGAPHVSVTVTDTGMGIDADVLPHVFEPFFTTKEVGQGTGLGLPTCFGIVTQHGGRIAVESRVGEGTTVRVLLPRIDPADVQTDEAPLPERIAGGTMRGHETVLLVEDEEQVRTLATHVLSSYDYDVLVAENGEQAVEIAQARAPGALHLLLTDILMPRMRGPEVAERVRVLHPDIRVLFMSGYTGPLASGAPELVEQPVLEKPFAPATLVQRVRGALDAPARDRG